MELVDPSTATGAELDGGRVTMSNEEAHQRFLAALMARPLSDQAKAFSDEQLRVLLNAQIDDVAALKDLLANLTPHEVEAHINLMLEANPSFMQEFDELFWGGIAGQMMPPTTTETREALLPALRNV